MDTPEKLPILRRFRITQSRKPDIFTTGGKHCFIDDVIRASSRLLLLHRIDVDEYAMKCESFSHITPMAEK
jgi:hypothetical protein